MGLKRLAAKIVEYNERLESGKASQIEPSHVERTLKKLRKKSRALQEDLAQTTSAEKRARLQKKLDVAQAHIERAEVLLNSIR